MILLQRDFQRNFDDLTKVVSDSPGKAAAVTFSITACAYLLLSSLKKRKYDDKKGLKEIPSPKGAVPYFGHLFSVGEIPIKQFNKWHEELGPIISVRMGVKQWISVGEPYLAYQIFNINGKYTSGRPHATFLSKYYAAHSKGLVAGNPSVIWNKTRGAALQILSPKNREHFEKLHIPEADDLIDKLIATTNEKGSVNVSHPLHFASLNVILTTCFGQRAESIEDPLFKEVIYLMEDTGKRIAADINTFLPFMKIFDVLFRKEKSMRKFIVERRDPLFKKLIQEAIDNKVDCFATSLLEMEDVNDFDNIMVTLSDSILAGTDTSAVMLAWSMIILCRYPEIQRRIRFELDQFIRTYGRLPTFDERESLPYSISVQKECMRFRPTTVFGLSHEATEDFEVNGYLIPKGATLLSNMHAIHHDKTFYEDAHKFNPERFLDDLRPMYTSANAPAEGRDHFNFGFGRRVCPGAFLAELQIFNVWVRLFARCVIEPVIGENGTPEYPDMDTIAFAGVITPPSNPVMRIVKREDALI